MLHLETPAVAILLGVTSPSSAPPLSPAQVRVLPRPLWTLARGSDWLYLLDQAKPQKGHAWGPDSPKQPSCRESRPRASAPPLFLDRARI